MLPAMSIALAPSTEPSDLPEVGQEEETYLEDTIILDTFSDGGMDDAEAVELDIGEELDSMDESSGDSDPVELDLGAQIDFSTSAAESEEDDDGLDIDPAVGLDLPDALGADDGSEGMEDRALSIDESKFPKLEIDDGSEGIAAERAISLGSASDEASVPPAALLWQVFPGSPSLEACTALAGAAHTVVAASSDLLWFREDGGSPLRLGVDGSQLSDLVLLGADRDVALASTRTGQLFRRARFASQAEQLLRFRDQVGFSKSARLDLTFGSGSDTNGASAYVRTQDGSLLHVLDAGDRFERVECHGKVLALSREAPLALVARGTEHVLAWLSPATPREQKLSGMALEMARRDHPLLATHGLSVALAEPGKALVASADGGQHFRRVPGSAGTTALSAGEVAGKSRLFAAVYAEASDTTLILLIDPEGGEACYVARIENSHEHGASDPVDRGEWAKVARLVWHAASQRLWAAGGFGVLSFAPEATS